jgi:periplasmic divalent cation tolerance protein
MQPIALIYVTFPTEEVARKTARHLLEQQLAACVVILPASSMYPWEGRIVDDSEWIGLYKTNVELSDRVEAAIRAMHPYQIPCIIRIPVQANADYANWIKSTVQQP